ncbi:MAG TPA: subclass B3 metallo-beta-lactamase [Blastocatellia bacterium]
MPNGSDRAERPSGEKLSRGASRWLAFAIVLVLGFGGFGQGQQKNSKCSQCAVWNTSQTPFRIYGNTYYVGPHGLSSILVTSEAGHILMDGALEESAPQIAANIRSLGFRVEDIKLIVNTHVHFDHAGGIAELQRLSGARVVASQWSSDVMTRSGVGRGDPQFGSIRPIPLVPQVSVLTDGERFRVGNVEITAHLTPGHTPGGTSWTWKSCEGDRCLNMVYADSLTAVSADGFKFSDSRDYPDAIRDFEKSFTFLESVPCDILITTHPDASHLWDRVDGRKRGVSPDPMINLNACRQLAKDARDDLNERLAHERER